MEDLLAGFSGEEDNWKKGDGEAKVVLHEGFDCGNALVFSSHWGFQVECIRWGGGGNQKILDDVIACFLWTIIHCWNCLRWAFTSLRLEVALVLL